MKKLKLFLSLLILVFSLQLSNAQYTKLYDFPGAISGGAPNGSLISIDSFFYGMTYYGGIEGMGVLFKIQHDGTGYSKLLDFVFNLGPRPNGSYPNGSLYFDGTFLYGMTKNGGNSNLGVLFKIKPDGKQFSILHTFWDGLEGPYGTVCSDGTFLYGLSSQGGHWGFIFKVLPDGTNFSSVHDFGDFQWIDGYSPYGSPILLNSYLYGMTSKGSSINRGVIFKVKTDGNEYATLFNFSWPNDGANPNGSLITDGTNLYGMTNLGGAYNKGTIFKIKLDGTNYSRIFDFAGLNGSNPLGDLISDGNYLYGMTDSGGVNNLGTVFRIKPDGTGYAKLYDFDGYHGQYPCGSLITDGVYLYGMTSYGGSNYSGTIFKISKSTTGVAEVNSNRTEKLFTVYPNPSNGKFTISFKNKPQTANLKLTVHDILGEEVYSTTNDKPQTTNCFAIDISTSPKGIYFIKINDGENNFSEKILIE